MTNPYHPTNSLAVPLDMASAIGLQEAIFLQQILHMEQKKTLMMQKKLNIGRDPYSKWGNCFPYWTCDTLQHIISNLQNIGIITYHKDQNSKSNDNEYQIDCVALFTYMEDMASCQKKFDALVTTPKPIEV